ncbi:thiamine phosphate synthase [Bacillaceae bacterium SIJ1]|uniref:thiamine phosphate synthase n=1 Tax=Litoribacterium kuwaitense TaxID=1398745 RepID=UPI0013ECF032|nr:thiamine phosphate synthase [Litoribacterium kuwaitense]NGP43568.1 thiamine phosphate synthase [Litoribacterium kuwaitense]
MQLGPVYSITGEVFHPGVSMLEVMEEALKGGANIVQLRDKHSSKPVVYEKAKQLKKLCDQYDVPFIINDYIDIALDVDATGVHLGQDDTPIEEARRQLGPGKVIGISTHGMEQALDAQARGADYIGAGPVYETNTKEDVVAPVGLEYIKALKESNLHIPFVAIGGIKLHNLQEVIEAGAASICMVSEIVGHQDPAYVVRKAHELLKTHNSISVQLNGKTTTTNVETVEALVKEIGIDPGLVVTEVDGQIIQEEDRHSVLLHDGMSIEMVQFVGGG